ncbi:DUF3990 domain-containing protein [Segatella hominis]|uniref:DUF3990 domain-containing protein n=1 Tax=Segatella hominis TaxID=2518605 RepID=UPI001F2B7731|nr:DUF3990 domain-containing protein [Segatella hominis]
MSKVYHGSIEEVRKPEIRQPNRSLDYGSGFYTTTSYEQAKKLVDQYLFHTEKSLLAIKDRMACPLALRRQGHKSYGCNQPYISLKTL